MRCFITRKTKYSLVLDVNFNTLFTDDAIPVCESCFLPEEKPQRTQHLESIVIPESYEVSLHRIL